MKSPYPFKNLKKGDRIQIGTTAIKGIITSSVKPRGNSGCTVYHVLWDNMNREEGPFLDQSSATKDWKKIEKT